jgi:hypothetical protein
LIGQIFFLYIFPAELMSSEIPVFDSLARGSSRLQAGEEKLRPGDFPLRVKGWD